MRPVPFSFLCIALCALAVTGCVSLDPEHEQASVLDAATQRSGVTRDAVTSSMDEPLDEAAAIALALANNHSLMAQLAEAGLARADWAIAARPINPLVDVVSLPGDGGRVWDVDVRASLLGVAATPWRAEAARQRYQVRETETVLAAVDFIAETRRAWVEAVAARQRLDLQARIRDAAAASLVVAEEMRSAGSSPVIDLERERVFEQQARLDYLEAEHTSLQARLTLQRQLGVDLDAATLPDRLTAPPPASLEAFEADALAASLPLAAARARVEAAARDAGLENWASVLEHVELGGVWEREDREWTRGWTVEFALPIFDTGHARRTAARLRAEQAIDRHAALVHDIRTTIRAATAGAELSANRVEQLETEALPTSDRLMDATLSQYNAMQVSVFDLMSAVQLRTRTGQAYVDALADLHRARITLQQLRAGGSPLQPGLSAGSDAGSGSTAGSAEGGH